MNIQEQTVINMLISFGITSNLIYLKKIFLSDIISKRILTLITMEFHMMVYPSCIIIPEVLVEMANSP